MKVWTLTALGALALALAAVLVFPLATPQQQSLRMSDDDASWNVLAPTYPSKGFLDALSFEWEYFQIHSPHFHGVIGYVLQNPRERSNPISQLIPTGLGVAFGGILRSPDQTLRAPFSNYANINPSDFSVGEHLKHVQTKPESSLQAGLKFLGSEAAQLTGSAFGYSWDLVIKKDSLLSGTPTGSFPPAQDTNMTPVFPGQSWTVHALWPKAVVEGFLNNTETGETLPISGKAYRENSWGRYAMPLDGWDFLVFNQSEEKGVEFVLQTYHHSEKMDFLDLAFVDGIEVKSLRFLASANQVQWEHQEWEWDVRARQCMPLDWKLSAENETYRFEAVGAMPLDTHQAPFLSDVTLGTKVFFIQEQYPDVSGKVIEKNSERLVAEFQARGGGEFAFARSLTVKSKAQCQEFGKKFRHPK